MKLYLLLIAFILVMGLASATQQTLGQFEINENVNLQQNCLNSTYANISKIVYPNSSYDDIDKVMSKNGDDYSYLFNLTQTNGQYFIYGNCDENGQRVNWVYDFFIGDDLDTGKAIVYIFLLLILVGGFTISLFGIFKVGNEKGTLALYWVCHLLFIAITFIAWDLSQEFLIGSTFIIGFFRIAFLVSSYAIFPMVLLSIAWIFYIHTYNDDIKKLMEHGLDFDEASERAGRNRK